MKKIFICIIALFATILLIISPEKSVGYALDSLGICYEVIIPSLFPFFVCSSLLVYSGFCDSLSKSMRFVMKPLFNINGAGAAAFVLGLVSGYPLGALTACQLYEGSYLSKSEAERLLAFCNNSGPLFILGAVGAAMYHSVTFGVILYCSHILAAFTVGIIMRFYKRDSYTPPHAPIATVQKSVGEIFRISLSNSVNSILTVCGAVIFVSVISKLFLEFVPATGIMHSVILGGFEFVSGMSELSGLDISLFSKLLLSSWIVGFAGLSVHLQVMAVVSHSGLSLVPYITGKVMHGIISAFYSFLLWKICMPARSVFAPASRSLSVFTSSLYTLISVGAIVAVCIMLSVFLYHKNTKAQIPG